jgi:hypothetical protein
MNLIASNGIIFFVVEIAGFIRAESESFGPPTANVNCADCVKAPAGKPLGKQAVTSSRHVPNGTVTGVIWIIIGVMLGRAVIRQAPRVPSSRVALSA